LWPICGKMKSCGKLLAPQKDSRRQYGTNRAGFPPARVQGLSVNLGKRKLRAAVFSRICEVRRTADMVAVMCHRKFYWLCCPPIAAKVATSFGGTRTPNKTKCSPRRAVGLNVIQACSMSEWSLAQPLIGPIKGGKTRSQRGFQ